LRGDSAMDQRLRLEMEGVTFRGRRVNMRLHEFKFGAGKKNKGKPQRARRATEENAKKDLTAKGAKGARKSRRKAGQKH